MTAPKKVSIDQDVADICAGLIFPADAPGIPLTVATADPDAIKAMADLLARAKAQLSG